MQKLWHFVIYLLLPKMFKWNSEHVFTVSKEQSILLRETIQNTFFFIIMSLFRPRHFILYQASHSRAMVLPCGALVKSSLSTQSRLITLYQTTNFRLVKIESLCRQQNDKIISTKVVIFGSDSVKNIAGKGENAGYKHFLLFLQCFQKGFSSG